MSSHVTSLGHGRRLALLLGLGLAVVAVACLASLAVGATVVPLAHVWETLTGSAPHGIVEARLDRTALGVVVGAAMGCAGAAMQALTRNPLADPGILGVNAGAALATPGRTATSASASTTASAGAGRRRDGGGT